MIGLLDAGKLYAVHTDQVHRPVAITDSNRAIVWKAQGLPFDRRVSSNTFGEFDIGFPGQSLDDETGLWHNGYRDYNPATGRYIQSDPIGLASGVNTYAYVGGNPISNVDPW